MEGIVMAIERKELFSEKVISGKRTYYFDVKESTDGIAYLVIDESKKIDGNYEHNRIMIFEEDILKFNQGYKKTIKFILKRVIE